MADQCRPQSFHLLFKFFLRDRAADDHELVPADAAGFTGEHIVQRVSCTADQGVARRMAEAVVAELQAVEIHSSR